MASPVKDAKAKVQAQYPGASVHSRGRGWLKHQHPSNPNKFILDTQVGGSGWHFGQGPFTEADEVDTAWVASGGAWDWEVTKNDFHSFIRDSVPVSYRYVDAETSHFVELTVNAIEWVNDEGQSESAASFSQVTPVIDDGDIRWNGIAPGWDVEVQAQTARLAKWLHIDSLANLGSPTIGGTNIRLQMQLTWQKSSGLEVWVDGVQWNEQNNTWAETSGDIEFRDETTQEAIFYFEKPKGHDDSIEDNNAPMTQRVARRGANFYSEIETPWAWLQDASELGGGSMSLSGNVIVDETDEWFGFYWSPVTIDDGATIDVAYMTIQYFHGSSDEANVLIDFEDSSTPSVFTTAANDISSRTGTTATVAWDDNEDVGADVNQNTDSLVSIIQELVHSYDYSSGLAMVSRWVGNGTALEDCGYRDWDENSSTAAILHIEFTGGGTTLSIDIGADEAAYQGTGVRILGP
jgi:hypothetical protein